MGGDMTKIVEERHPGESWLMWRLGNLLTVDEDSMRSVAVAWIFKEGGRWVFRPRLCDDRSLFFNAVFFLRLLWPLGIFWMIRWAAEGTRAYWQSGLGFKGNGRFSITFRVQGDDASARGVTGPNLGQARGFEFGAH